MIDPRDPDTVDILAVDPGLGGAFAWMRMDALTRDIELLDVQDVPVVDVQMQSGTMRKEVDLRTLRAVLALGPSAPRLAVIEKVGAAPGQGVTSMFRFGHVTGVLTGACAAFGMDVTTPRPQQWQAWAKKRPGKDASREQAARLFPAFAPMLKRKKDADRADAILIGYGYLRQY